MWVLIYGYKETIRKKKFFEIKNLAKKEKEKKNSIDEGKRRIIAFIYIFVYYYLLTLKYNLIRKLEIFDHTFLLT